MKWYDTVCDNFTSNPLITGEEFIGGIEEYRLCNGERMDTWSEDFWLKPDKPEYDGDPDDMLATNMSVPIYSPRLRAALDRAGIGGIQYLPIRLLDFSGKLVDVFWVANIIEVRDALDVERSNVQYRPLDDSIPERRGTIRSVTHTTLKAAALHGCDIFRLRGYEVAYYVSERFRSIFESNGFTGYGFYEVRVV